MHQLGERIDDVVDRDDVGATGVGQQDWSERRQLGQLRQDAEEVVRAVDLVHFARLRIADDHRRPVDPIAQPRLRANQQLRLELGLVIGRRQVLSDVEVVFGVFAAIGPGHRDRRHVVQRRAESTGQGDHRPGAIHVRGTLRVLGDGDVVDGGAVHHVFDGAELGDGVVGQAEMVCGEVADQRLCPITPGVVALRGQPFEPGQRLAPDQHPDLGIGGPIQNSRHHSPANKPGTAGNDIAHASHGCRLPDECPYGVTRSVGPMSLDAFHRPNPYPKTT
jgi:hypothetical protein